MLSTDIHECLVYASQWIRFSIQQMNEVQSCSLANPLQLLSKTLCYNKLFVLFSVLLIFFSEDASFPSAQLSMEFQVLLCADFIVYGGQLPKLLYSLPSLCNSFLETRILLYALYHPTLKCPFKTCDWVRGTLEFPYIATYIMNQLYKGKIFTVMTVMRQSMVQLHLADVP